MHKMQVTTTATAMHKMQARRKERWRRSNKIGYTYAAHCLQTNKLHDCTKLLSCLGGWDLSVRWAGYLYLVVGGSQAINGDRCGCSCSAPLSFFIIYIYTYIYILE